MKKLRTSILMLMITLVPLSAYCGTLTGTIESILFNKDLPNMVFIQINSTSTNAPACASSRSRMVMEIITPTTEALLPSLIALKLSKPDAIVSLVGTGSCTLWGDTESFSYTFLSSTGAPGLVGPAGAAGLQGATGAPGPAGPKGDKGDPAPSAICTWNGHTYSTGATCRLPPVCSLGQNVGLARCGNTGGWVLGSSGECFFYPAC